MADEIIQEVWRSKDEIAKEFNYDIVALATELQKKQEQSDRSVVNLSAEATGQAAENMKSIE